MSRCVFEMSMPTVESGIFSCSCACFRALTLVYPFRPWEKTVATKLRSGPCSAQRLAVRPPPPPALPTGGRQGVDPPRSVHGDKTNKQAAERYFAEYRDPQFLIEKPFSDAPDFAGHLIAVGILVAAARLRPGDTVVEFGAGSCWLSHFLNRFGCRTISVDVSETALAVGRRLFERDPRTNWSLDPQFLPYDGHTLPLEDASCDRIVVYDAFHHVPNQRVVLTEMHRVLTAEGIVAMSEPGKGHALRVRPALQRPRPRGCWRTNWSSRTWRCWPKTWASVK